MRFPDDTQRLVIVGATGTGKTVAGAWHLSHRDFHIRPWLIYNWKHDQFLDSIPNVREIGLLELPATPGVYMVHPGMDDEDLVDNQMREIWKHEDIGVFVDEAYMVGNRSRGFRALLTQGRSKHIPMITLAQRPTWCDKFMLTEAEYYQIYRLQWEPDVKAMAEFAKGYRGAPPQPHWSHYYDAGENSLTPLKPVPHPDVIRATFERRLRRRKMAV